MTCNSRKPIGAACRPRMSRAAVKRTGGRPAFTLLEVLIALALMLPFLATLYSAVTLHSRYSTAGQASNERSQIVRAIFQQLDRDIRSVAYRMPERPRTTSSHQARSMGFRLSRNLATQEATVRRGFGLVGGPQTLALCTNEWTWGQSGSSALNNVLGRQQPFGEKTVLWCTAGSERNSLDDLFSRSLARTSTRVSVRTTIPGLSRSVADSVPREAGNPHQSPQSEAARVQMLAEEIRFLKFRYFDGVEWSNGWSSVTRNALPRAVEVTLGFADAAEREVLERGNGNESTQHVFRLVVDMSLSGASPAKLTRGARRWSPAGL